MELDGEFHIAADRETVWRALNDPEMLRLAVPGCETLEKVSNTEFTANCPTPGQANTVSTTTVPVKKAPIIMAK